MASLIWAALSIGAGLVVSGVRVIRRPQPMSPSNTKERARFAWGWLWVGHPLHASRDIRHRIVEDLVLSIP